MAATRARLLVWGMVAVLVAIDAVIATPLGLTLLYFVPIVLGARRLPRAEVIAMALVSAAARIIFGPIVDPLGLGRVTFHVSEDIQIVVTSVTSLVSYVTVALLLSTVFRQHHSLRELRMVSETDSLTGLANRRAIDTFVAANEGSDAGVIMIDLDHFKKINDTHGHAAGDAVLVELARRLLAAVRTSDVVGRSGGEEFVVVLAEANAEFAERLAGRIAESIRSKPFAIADGEIPVTASLGVAVGPLGPATIAEADRALYRAKQGGRDRVVLADPPPRRRRSD